ncbi:MAG: DUF4405 domain-containing protein [Desulfosarcina sp.]|nr:DUF4405 domain-containing protein [Desulfobacterales bacterium]
MNIRRTVSLTAALAFVVMLLTSVVLYIVPQGRVAYWADWRLAGLSKTQWGEIHINTGLLFLVALGLHVYYNWKPLTLYLKDRARRWKVLTPEFNLATVLVAVFIGGTLGGWPPFATILSFQEAIKTAAAQKYGEPPYGHAELSSLEAFARKMGIDPQAARAMLTAAGYRVTDGQQSLQDLAATNGVSPQRLYQTMMATRSAAASASSREIPQTPPAGIGKLSLEAFSRQYGLDSQKLLQSLENQGLEVRADMTIKAMAAANNRSPVDLYDLLRTVASASSAP